MCAFFILKKDYRGPARIEPENISFSNANVVQFFISMVMQDLSLVLVLAYTTKQFKQLTHLYKCMMTIPQCLLLCIFFFLLKQDYIGPQRIERISLYYAKVVQDLPILIVYTT